MPAAPPSARELSQAGLIGIVAGLLGPLLAIVMIAWPAQVPAGPLHYPFTRTGFIVAQCTFFVHHFGLVVVSRGFAKSHALGASRFFRGAAWLAVTGTALLTAAELNALRYIDWDAAKANESAMGAVYGIACNAVGLGMLVAGIGTLRARAWSGWHRFVPLAIGIATFAELTPGMFGGYVTARLAIGFWIFLFALLGLGVRADGPASGSAT